MAELIRVKNVHTGAFAKLPKQALRFFPDFVAYDGPDPDEVDETAAPDDSGDGADGDETTFADQTAGGGAGGTPPVDPAYSPPKDDPDAAASANKKKE